MARDFHGQNGASVCKTSTGKSKRATARLLSRYEILSGTNAICRLRAAAAFVALPVADPDDEGRPRTRRGAEEGVLGLCMGSPVPSLHRLGP